MFVLNSGDGSIGAYAIGKKGSLAPIGSFDNLKEFLSYFDKQTDLSGGVWVGMEVSDPDDARRLAPLGRPSELGR